jgi:hypothetical protein
MRTSDALRPHVLIEFTAATLSLRPLVCPVSSFALVWRVPDRVRQPLDDDPDLVRHIHDLAALQPYAMTHSDFRRLAIEMIQRDDDRCEKIAGLSLQKKLHILMDILVSDTEYETEYIRFVQGMSYASGSVPTYEQAMEKLNALIDHLK